MTDSTIGSAADAAGVKSPAQSNDDLDASYQKALQTVAYAIYDYTGQATETEIPERLRGAYVAMAHAAITALLQDNEWVLPGRTAGLRALGLAAGFTCFRKEPPHDCKCTTFCEALRAGIAHHLTDFVPAAEVRTKALQAAEQFATEFAESQDTTHDVGFGMRAGALGIAEGIHCMWDKTTRAEGAEPQPKGE